VPRGYTHKLPKKMRRAALLSALSQLLQESTLTVVEDLQLENYNTKRIAEILASLSLSATSTLIVIDEPNPTVEASARNLPGVSVIRSEGVNVYDLLRHKSVLMTRAAVEKLQARLSSGTADAATAEGDAG
jgi:large subunit ribosomal protein L4